MSERIRVVFGAVLRKGAYLKFKHIFLIVLALLTLAFLQPLVMLIGALVIIVSVAAYVYSDMAPEAQHACEQQLLDWMARLRGDSSRSKTLNHEDRRRLSDHEDDAEFTDHSETRRKSG